MCSIENMLLTWIPANLNTFMATIALGFSSYCGSFFKAQLHEKEGNGQREDDRPKQTDGAAGVGPTSLDQDGINRHLLRFPVVGLGLRMCHL